MQDDVRARQMRATIVGHDLCPCTTCGNPDVGPLGLQRLGTQLFGSTLGVVRTACVQLKIRVQVTATTRSRDVLEVNRKTSISSKLSRIESGSAPHLGR